MRRNIIDENIYEILSQERLTRLNDILTPCSEFLSFFGDILDDCSDRALILLAFILVSITKPWLGFCYYVN